MCGKQIPCVLKTGLVGGASELFGLSCPVPEQWLPKAAMLLKSL